MFKKLSSLAAALTLSLPTSPVLAAANFADSEFQSEGYEIQRIKGKCFEVHGKVKKAISCDSIGFSPIIDEATSSKKKAVTTSRGVNPYQMQQKQTLPAGVRTNGPVYMGQNITR